jgi:aspartate aminotransferase
MSVPAPTAATMPRSGIREVMDLAWATPDRIHLEVGEPSFATPAHIAGAVAEAVRTGWTKYVPNAGIGELRSALAEKSAGSASRSGSSRSAPSPRPMR